MPPLHLAQGRKEGENLQSRYLVIYKIFFCILDFVEVFVRVSLMMIPKIPALTRKNKILDIHKPGTKVE
jgi:hypothetical protein